MSTIRRLASSAIRLVVRGAETLMGLAGRHAVAAVTTIAAAAGAFLASAPWGSILGLPFGVVAREIERARTSDLRRRAQQVTAQCVTAVLDARLQLSSLEPFLVRDDPPHIRDFADIDDRGRAGAVFHPGRDGYQLEEQLAKQHGWVAGATGGSAPHLSVGAQRALSRFLDALAVASEAARDIALADGTINYARMRSEGHDEDQVAAEAGERDRVEACARLRQSIRDAIAAETELAR